MQPRPDINAQRRGPSRLHVYDLADYATLTACEAAAQGDDPVDIACNLPGYVEMQSAADRVMRRLAAIVSADARDMPL